MTSAKKSFSLKTFNENERTSCWDNFSIQCYNTAVNEWKRKRRKEEYDKYWWKISENKYEKAHEKEI